METPAAPARPPRSGLAEARALHEAGILDEAEALCRELMAGPSTRGQALHRLGLIAATRRKFESAIHILSAAAKVLPASAELHNDLGNALIAIGQVDVALAAYGAAVRIEPGFAGAHHNTGLTLHRLRRFAEAVASARRAVELAPEWAAAHHALGCALGSAQQAAAAAEAFRRAVSLAPQVADYWHDHALCLVEMLQFDEALIAIDRAVALAPDRMEFRMQRAEILFRSGRGAAAGAAFAAETGAGAGAAGWNGVARVRLTGGDFAGAASALRAALREEPGHAESLRLLALVGTHPASESELVGLKQMAGNVAAPVRHRIAAGFAAGKKLDDAGRSDEAFACFAAANAACREWRASAGARFSADALRAAVARLIAEPAPDAALVDSDLPVFIVGMPRSGTSLVEQIAASHPAVFGAGELTAVHAYARTRQAPTEEWAAGHLARLQALAPAASRVIDKTPDNLFHLGLLARSYRRPRVVLCLRDPRDTCLSCFFTYFPTGNLWSYDLRDCGIRCVETQRLARHWMAAESIRLHVVHYERLISDPEGESRRLIGFLGLPWDDACLSFHETVRPVATPSFWQVRQPIYDRSIGRWRPYAPHLEPLLEALGALNGGPDGPMLP